MISRSLRSAAVALCLAWISASSVAPFAQQTPPTAPSKKTTGTAAISGVVIEGATNQPVPGATVALSVSGFSARTLTDSKGRYVFRSLPAGPVSVFGSCQGYAPDDGTVSASIGHLRAQLHDNEWIADGRIVLWRLGAIGGTVVDEKSEPVVGARVRVFVRVPIGGTFRWAMGTMVLTDDRGIYEIGGLRKGTYVISVPAVQTAVPVELVNSFKPLQSTDPFSLLIETPPVPGVNVANTRLLTDRYLIPPTTDGTQAYPTVFYPAARSLDDAVPVTIADGETRPAIDFVMKPVAVVSVSGRLTGPNDAVGRMPIRLMPIGTEALGFGAEQASGLSAPDGSFTLLGVPAGQYTLQAGRTITGLRAIAWTRSSARLPVPPGFDQGFMAQGLASSPEVGSLLFDMYTAPLGDDYSVTSPIVVGSTNVSDVTLVLRRSATMSGRVVREDGSSYSPPISPPSPGVSVWADPAAGLGVRSSMSTKVGPDGEFTIDGLRPGDYFLRISGLKSVTALDGDHTDRPFTVTSGDDITGIVATLASSWASLSGNVRDKDGRPIRTGAVILFPTDPNLWKDFGTVPPRIATTTFWAGADYQMTRVGAGDYYAIAVDSTRENAWLEPGFFARFASLATRVTMAWGDKRKLNLILQDVSK